jgi:HEAT repeat protein
MTANRIGTLLIFVLLLGCGNRRDLPPIASLPPHVQPVVQKLQDADFNVRMYAARELSEMGARAATAVPFLAEALHDKAAKVRVWAALALGEMGPLAREAIPDLEWAVENNEWKDCRESARQALKKIRGS